MKTVESKVASIKRLDEDVFNTLSNFNNFTPYAQAAKLENWRVGDNWCRFDVQGIRDAGLDIVERNPFHTIKVKGNDRIPFEFNVWIQLKMVAPYDTRMKITLKAKMNMMIEMVVGSKLQQVVDELAQRIADALNAQS